MGSSSGGFRVCPWQEKSFQFQEQKRQHLCLLPSSLGESLERPINGEEMKNLLSLKKQSVKGHWDTVWRSGQLPAAAGAAESHEKHKAEKRDGLEGRMTACAGAYEPLNCPPLGFPLDKQRCLGRTLHAGTRGSWVPSPSLHHQEAAGEKTKTGSLRSEIYCLVNDILPFPMTPVKQEKAEWLYLYSVLWSFWDT